MPNVNRPIALRSRYLFPITSPPIRDGTIVISNGEILTVGSTAQITRQFDLAPLDLGDVVLLPGLINAHTHLEFSDLTNPLGQPGMPFTHWVREVMSYRRERPQPNVGVQNRILLGLRELIETGTAVVGEIATHAFIPGDAEIDTLVSLGVSGKPSSLLNELHQLPLVTAFFELIGHFTERMESAKEMAAAYCSSGNQRTFWRTALSPHAPYSCHPELLRWACEQSATNRFPVAMHLAETREESQLLRDGTGEFRRLLEEFGAWNSNSFSTSRAALDFLQILAKADRALVVHGNYLNSGDIAFLANHRRQMSVVYCPRTHAYFGHTTYPLREMLKAGVRLVLGTDSRASNPDLSVWQEARFVSKQFAEISPDEILAMTTIHGAAALGMEDHLGSLESGKRAYLNCLPLSNSTERITAEVLLSHPGVPSPLALISESLGS